MLFFYSLSNPCIWAFICLWLNWVTRMLKGYFRLPLSLGSVLSKAISCFRSLRSCLRCYLIIKIIQDQNKSLEKKNSYRSEVQTLQNHIFVYSDPCGEFPSKTLSCVALLDIVLHAVPAPQSYILWMSCVQDTAPSNFKQLERLSLCCPHLIPTTKEKTNLEMKTRIKGDKSSFS